MLLWGAFAVGRWLVRALRLRTQLVLLVLAASVPLLAFALGMGVWSARQHEDDIEDGLRQTAAALSLAVRRELDVATAMLEAVSRSRTLDDGDFQRFHSFAQPIGTRFGGWVVVLDPNGDQLVSTLYPFGTPLTRVVRREWLDRALETGRPVISDMILGAVSQRHVVSVLVPVVRDGRARAALALTIGPDHFSTLLAHQAASSDRRWLLVDGAWRVVAWSLRAGRYLGEPAPDWMQAALQETDGVAHGPGLDETTAVGAIGTIPGTTWKVGVAAPAMVIAQAWWQAVGAVLVGGLAIVLVSVAAAILLSRRMARPFSELADAADGILDGTAPPPSRGVPAREFLALREALVKAGTLARDAADARERVAVAEAEARLRAHSEERLKFLLNELDHRVKNVLAAIQALAFQTGRTADSVPRFLAEFQARIMALASVHDLVGSGSNSASLCAVIDKTLAPYLDGNRIVVSGDDVMVTPATATALAMAIHELATNAHKHGALSVPDGRVAIAVRVDGRREPRVAILWSETGGPAVQRPGRRGFGTRLLEGALADQLEGAVSLEFSPTGLSCAIEFPLGKAA